MFVLFNLNNTIMDDLYLKPMSLLTARKIVSSVKSELQQTGHPEIEITSIKTDKNEMQ